MRNFLINTLFFSIFAIITFLLLHWYSQKLSNDYTFKKEKIEENISSIKILNLGNSQALYSINPQHFSKRGFNLAHVSQTLDIDYLLFDKYADRLDSLEYLIIQISYTSFSENLGYGSEAWRVKNYERFYDINPPIEQSKLINSIIVTERNNLLRIYEHIRGKSLIFCNEYGFDTSFSDENRIKNFNKHAQKTATHHKAKSDGSVISNKNYLNQIINKASEKNISIIIYIPPVHPSYLALLDAKQLNTMYVAIKEASEHKNIILIDWLKNKSFDDDDFYDSDHLNSKGAEKATLMLDSLVISKQ